MRRREFIALFGSAAAVWPLVAGAQPQPALPIVALVNLRSAEAAVRLMRFVKVSTRPATPRAKTSLWSTTGWTVDLTACRLLWPTLSTVEWPLSPHPAATMRPKRPKLRPQRSPLKLLFSAAQNVCF